MRQQDVVREPTVLVETETVDTGERKELFGRTARHVITTRRVTSLGRAKQAPGKTVTDGWYIDLDTSISCDPSWRPAAYGRAFLVTRKQGEQCDVPSFMSVGEPERGYALLNKNTFSETVTLPDGSMTEHVSVVETEVFHLSTAAIDPTVFEVPRDFRPVETIRQEPTPPLSIRWKQAYDRLVRRFESAK